MDTVSSAFLNKRTTIRRPTEGYIGTHKHIFDWFIPVVCEYNVKYLNDIRWVRQNTTLYYDVMCHRTDNMFRPFTTRPSSGLTSRAKEEIVKL